MFVNISVHMTPTVRQENMIAETSLQFVERTGRVASAPRNATASQPKGPTNVTTRMEIGYESSRFEKTRATLKVMKKRALPPTKYATNANQKDALSCVIRFMHLEIPTPTTGEGCGSLLSPFDAGPWGNYADAVAGKNGAVLFAGCVAGVEREGKDVETKCCAKSLDAKSSTKSRVVAQRKLREL